MKIKILLINLLGCLFLLTCKWLTTDSQECWEYERIDKTCIINNQTNFTPGAWNKKDKIACPSNVGSNGYNLCQTEKNLWHEYEYQDENGNNCTLKYYKKKDKACEEINNNTCYIDYQNCLNNAQNSYNSCFYACTPSNNKTLQPYISNPTNYCTSGGFVAGLSGDATQSEKNEAKCKDDCCITKANSSNSCETAYNSCDEENE